MRAEGKGKKAWQVTLCLIRGIASPFSLKTPPKNTELVCGADRERFYSASCWVLQPRTNSHWGNNYFSSMGQRGGNPGGGGEPFCFSCANTWLRQLSSQHMMRQRVACLNLVQKYWHWTLNQEKSWVSFKSGKKSKTFSLQFALPHAWHLGGAARESTRGVKLLYFLTAASVSCYVNGL